MRKCVQTFGLYCRPLDLNIFYARFECAAETLALGPSPTGDVHVKVPPIWNTHPDTSSPTGNLFSRQAHQVSVIDTRKVFKSVKMGKAAGPYVLKTRGVMPCYSQLASVFTDIFNLSLSLCVVPNCFKKSVPVPKKMTATCMNDFKPVAIDFCDYEVF